MFLIQIVIGFVNLLPSCWKRNKSIALNPQIMFQLKFLLPSFLNVISALFVGLPVATHAYHAVQDTAV